MSNEKQDKFHEVVIHENDLVKIVIPMKNGKPTLKAKCPVCDTGMYKIGSK